MTDLKRSPLYDRHVDLGAKLADFGGWEMPIEYAASGGGVLREHAAVRESVGLFDVSHLGKASVTGAADDTNGADGTTARDFLNACLTNDLGRIGPGQAQYTLCCAEDGGTVDDLIAYLVADDELFLVPNAANTAEVVRRLLAAAPAGIEVRDRHQEFGVLALQGPRSREVLEGLGVLAPDTDLDYMAWVDASFDGRPVRVCRTGYTGEHGYELLPAWDDTVLLWDALSDLVRGAGGRAAGLGARDTLRTEMGYPLHGQDLGPAISPVQARASWAVGWKKDTFWGAEALRAERAGGAARTLWGLSVPGRGIPRAHMSLFAGDDTSTVVGEVTSGTFSPTLKHGIGLALVDTSTGLTEGSTVSVDVRGRRSPATLVKPPFVESHVR